MAIDWDAVRDEVAFRQDHVDPRADIREPAADDLENLLERIAISTGIRWSVVLDPVGREVKIDPTSPFCPRARASVRQALAAKAVKTTRSESPSARPRMTRL